MPATLGGRPLIDPADLFRVCLDRSLPTAPWHGLANSFRCPTGRGPGVGHVLMYSRDVNQVPGGPAPLDLKASHDLRFTDGEGNSITFRGLTVTRADRVVSGWDDSRTAPYLVRLADRRVHLAGVPVNAAYNLRDDSGYLSPTLKLGVAWTWQEVVEDLWQLLADEFDDLPAAIDMALPFTPHGTPEGFDFYGGNAWEALNSVLDRLACALVYDPTVKADEPGATPWRIVRLGSDDATATRTLTDWAKYRLRDSRPTDPKRSWRPEKVRVLFRRKPSPSTGDEWDHAETVTLAADPAVVAGTVVTLRDDLYALGATGTPTNAATLTARATERAADWLRARGSSGRPAGVTYRGARDGALLVGPLFGEWAVHDRGGGEQGGVRTEVASLPVPEWGRAEVTPGGGGGDPTFLVLLTERDFSGTFVKYAAVEVEASGSVAYAVKSGGRTFGFGAGQTPLYQQRNMPHPVVGVDGSGDPNFVKKGSVVRVWLGPDGIYFFKALAPVVPLRRTGDAGTVGETAFVRENRSDDPGAPTWVDGDEVEVVPVE